MLKQIINKFIPLTRNFSYARRPKVNIYYINSLDWDAINIYNQALTILDNDPNITVEDCINKANAYLCFDNFHWNSKQSFEQAILLDINKKYQREIDEGLKNIINRDEKSKKLYYIETEDY